MNQFIGIHGYTGVYRGIQGVHRDILGYARGI